MIHSDHDPSLSSDGLQCRQYGNRYPSLKCCKIPLIPNSILLQIIKIPQTDGIEGHLSAESSRQKKTLEHGFFSPMQIPSPHGCCHCPPPTPSHQNAHPRYGSTTPLPRESHWSCIPPERFEGFEGREKVEFSPFFAWMSSCTMAYPLLSVIPFCKLDVSDNPVIIYNLEINAVWMISNIKSIRKHCLIQLPTLGTLAQVFFVIVKTTTMERRDVMGCVFRR